jgi:hypothetical protein
VNKPATRANRGPYAERNLDEEGDVTDDAVSHDALTSAEETG